MAGSLHKLRPRSRRLNAAEALARLESSPLYQRRERQAREAMSLGHRSAVWYLASDYRERLLPMKEQR